MRAIVLVTSLFAAGLMGCATSRTIQGPNGEPAHFIKCGSAVIDACYEEAARVCPKGYVFLDRENNPNAMILPAGTGFLVARGPNTMLIQCK
jgi:hypothetical protein